MRTDRALLALVSLIFLVHTVAVSLSWYFIHPWMDIPMHIAGGFWLGLLFIYIFLERLRLLPTDMGFFTLLFLSVGFVALVGVGWEVYEYFSHIFLVGGIPFGGSVPGAHFDTLKDLFNDLLGGAIVISLYAWRRSRSRA